MAKKKVHPRLSADALELLEYIDADGPVDSNAALRKLTGDTAADHWKPQRVAQAIDELIGGGRIARQKDGSLYSTQTGDYSAVTAVDSELGIRVRIVTKVYAADESIDWGVTEGVRQQGDLAGELADLVVEKLRRVNGIGRFARRLAARTAAGDVKS